jgi:hypothetical protein
MMPDASAVRVAIDLIQVPSRVRFLRSEPLPEGVPLVLRIAAGDDAAEIAAAEAVGRPRELVREACAFFIEQILLTSDADSYRLLGADRHASAADLRRNMALLLRWLHPDMHHDHSMFAGRVIAAWSAIKTPERRAAYDSERQAAALMHRGSDGAGHPSRHAQDTHGRRRAPKGLIRRTIGKLRRGGEGRD